MNSRLIGKQLRAAGLITAAIAAMMVHSSGIASAEVINGCTIAPTTTCQNVDFRDQNLTERKLGNANLSGRFLNADDPYHAETPPFSNFIKANLTGTDLTNANLTNGVFYGATVDEVKISNAIVAGS